MNMTPQYWFPAKRFGWGWGLPIAWQGWLAVGSFVALALVGLDAVRSRYGDGAYVLYVLILTGGFLGICWKKGEPPKWRWGGGTRP
jgi:hypothetical protein